MQSTLDTAVRMLRAAAKALFYMGVILVLGTFLWAFAGVLLSH